MLKCLKVGTTNRGFTLIEVLVSLGTMAIGFVILMGLHYSSIRMEWSDTRRTEAIEIARTNLEMLRDPNKLKGTTCPSPPASGVYKCSFDTETEWRGIPQTTKATVTVEWEERVKMAGGRASLSPKKSRVQLTTLFNDDHPFTP